MSKQTLGIVIVLLLLLAGGSYYALTLTQSAVRDGANVDQATSSNPTQMANPASVNCVKTRGGTLEIIESADGQQGMCHLPDGTVCEEWALMRGTCGTQ